MIRDGIIKVSHNCFRTYVQIQDGVEYSEHTSMKEAKEAWEQGHKICNGGLFRKLKIYAVRQIVVDEVYEIDEMIKSNHILDYCELCKENMVRCKTCNNNCCNGGYGKVNGEKCTDCPDAYAMQDLYWEDPKSVEFVVDISHRKLN